jgi:hypothetical protein
MRHSYFQQSPQSATRGIGDSSRHILLSTLLQATACPSAGKAWCPARRVSTIYSCSRRNCRNAHFFKTYKRMEPTRRMDSTGLFSLITLSVPALTAFFSPHQLSAINPSCCTLVRNSLALRRDASRHVALHRIVCYVELA